jgi:hypothetical protein
LEQDEAKTCEGDVAKQSQPTAGFAIKAHPNILHLSRLRPFQFPFFSAKLAARGRSGQVEPML